ncbi:DUF3572 domain-containing protein [Aliiroseovarius crassostreae]|uniref:DUF3572 domain-containing protein n=1 Tax=Aliiroseovarius crassostreae TaxID=154981 RepID=UPI003C7A8069
MNYEKAEVIGLTAITWLVGNDDLLPVFMGATGAGVDDLKDGAANPEFLGAVLDFLMMDDQWVMAFCQAHSLPYETLQQARMVLPGGTYMNWT